MLPHSKKFLPLLPPADFAAYRLIFQSKYYRCIALGKTPEIQLSALEAFRH